MRDLTEGPITGQLIAMALPLAIGMLFQTLYLVVDMYFVAGIGETAIAGVATAGTSMFVIMALTQMLGVGAVALVSHAVGRKDQADANLIFNQSVVLSAICGAATLAAGWLAGGPYVRSMAADAATASAGTAFLYAYTPGLALQFALVALGAALRGTGIVKPTMVVQVLTVVLNTVLAPVLIAGWGTGHPLGAAGAGLASSIAVGFGVVVLWVYFARLEHYVRIDTRQWALQPAVIRRILNVGLPAGGEFLMMFVIIGIIYWVIRSFGPGAQAGFGVGGRVQQALFLPAMALAFAVPAVAGQNFGARKFERVRQTFHSAVLLSALLMLGLTLICQWRPEVFIEFFSRQPEVVAVGATYLHIVSWNFVPTGFIFTCSGVFQSLGNTWPSLASSASRLLTFVLPALYLSTLPNFTLRQVWFLSVTTVVLQALTSYVLVRREFRRKLGAPAAAVATAEIG